jgi:hypothetical protein
MSKHRKKTGPRFIQLFYFMLDSEAWKDIAPIERAIYLELTRRYNGSNNGRIGYSARQAAEDLKISKATAARALLGLQAHGFIVEEKHGAFYCKVRHASEYRLTIYDSDVATSYAAKLATKEFTRWTKIQNTGPVVRPTGPVVRPFGISGDTVGSKNRPHGIRGETVGAKN